MYFPVVCSFPCTMCRSSSKCCAGCTFKIPLGTPAPMEQPTQLLSDSDGLSGQLFLRLHFTKVTSCISGCKYPCLPGSVGILIRICLENCFSFTTDCVAFVEVVWWWGTDHVCACETCGPSLPFGHPQACRVCSTRAGGQEKPRRSFIK